MTASTLPGRASRANRPTVEALLAAAVSAVPGGRERPGQRSMAEAIAEAITTGEHLLVQAGTGTGKSLAYLAPSLLVDGPVVVSTATLALQSQLVDHDLPRLAAAVRPLLRRDLTFAVLKGRHHYLCMNKLESGTEEDPQDTLFDTESDGRPTRWLGEAGRLGKQVLRLRDWAMETETGDRDDLDPGVDDLAWRLASIPARECVGVSRCSYGDDCFAELARERARTADIVITNHSLLAIDMLSGGRILPEHRLLIIDEAHELVDRVSSASQAELTADLVSRAARRARSLAGADKAELLNEAGQTLGFGLSTAPQGRLTTGLPDSLVEALTLVDAHARMVFAAMGTDAQARSDESTALARQQAKTMVSDVSLIAQRLLAQNPRDVIWIDRNDRGRSALVVAPLSVEQTLQSRLYTKRTVIATSATLTLGGRFDSIARSLGLPVAGAPSPQPEPGNAGDQDDPTEEDLLTEVECGEDGVDEESPSLDWRSLDVGSPFDYSRQAILYVAAHLPRPTASGLSDHAAEELVDLVKAAGGRTLGLFSSRKAAERAAEVLRERTEFTVLLQGDEALPLLVRRFREEENSCLLGVMSLWQGVDVPGNSCQLVVIDRLPFPRPDEPLSSARSAAIDAAGGSGFATVSVPIAAVRLAQGAGRLVRSVDDRGVVAVLDPRLETARGYGTYLRNSLPPFWYTTSPEVVRAALGRLSGS